MIRTLLASMTVLSLTGCVTPVAEEVSQHQIADLGDSGPMGIANGEWRGTAKGIGEDRKPYVLVQTERVGPMLDGAVSLVEGRGYAEDGSLAFNAVGLITADAESGGYVMRSQAMGRSGTFPIVFNDSGFTWTVPLGPDAKMEYVAVVEDGTWVEVGHYVPSVGEPREVFRMELTRIGDTSWPSSGFVPPEN